MEFPIPPSKAIWQSKIISPKNYPDAVFNFSKNTTSGFALTEILHTLKLQKKKLRAVVMLPEDEVRESDDASCREAVVPRGSRVYNGPCCAVVFENAKDMDDFLEAPANADKVKFYAAQPIKLLFAAASFRSAAGA